MFKKLILASIIAVFSITSSFATIVHINQADAITFADNLKGIGLKKAKAIVTYREEHGLFKTVNDLVKVKGIGKKIVEKNRANLTVDATEDETTSTDESK